MAKSINGWWQGTAKKPTDDRTMPNIPQQGKCIFCRSLSMTATMAIIHSCGRCTQQRVELVLIRQASSSTSTIGTASIGFTTDTKSNGRCGLMRTMACDLPVDFDREATARNVRRFFQNRLDYYLSSCGSNRTDLKSPTLSLAGGGGTLGNHAEDKIINGMIAGVVCQCIATAIQNCSHRAKQPSYEILVGCYLDELKDWEVSSQCGFGKTRFQEGSTLRVCRTVSVLADTSRLRRRCH